MLTARWKAWGKNAM